MAKKVQEPEVLPPARASESGALAKTDGERALARPGRVGGRGFENLEREDILLPRIKLLQVLSPEVTGDLGKKAGQIYLNLSNTELGQKVLITPILHFRSRIKWNDKADGGGIDCSAPNARTPKDTKYATSCAACNLKDWDNTQAKKKDQQPKCTMYENFLVLIGDGTEAVILPMERTKTKVAKKFYSMMSFKNADMWTFQYELGVVKETNDADEPYFNYTVADTGIKTDERRAAMCEQFWQSLVDKDLTRNMEHPDEAVASDAGTATAGEGKY